MPYFSVKGGRMAVMRVTRDEAQSEAQRLWSTRKLTQQGKTITMQRSRQDQDVWERCQNDLEHFARTFFPHFCTAEWSAMHKDMFARDRADYGKRDLRDATAAPRGSAKTTIRGFIKICHDCCYVQERFIVIFSHTASL